MTAARLVTAPPMPTSASGVGRPSSARGRRRSRRARRGSGLGRDDAVEAVPLGVAHRADVHAEPLVDPAAAAEGELRAAAAGVEHDERAPRETEPGPHREVGEPPLLLAGDDLDLDAGAVLHRVDERARCCARCAARRCRPRRSRRRRSAAPRRPCPRSRRPSAPSAPRRSRPSRARPSPRRVTSARSTIVRHAPSAPLADVELDRVRADVDDRETLRPEPDERREAARVAHVREARRARARARSRSPVGVFRLDRDRARCLAVGAHLGELRHAAVDGVVGAPLVHLHGAQASGPDAPARRPTRRASRCCARLGRASPGSRGPCTTSSAGSGNAGLHHRHPPLESVAVLVRRAASRPSGRRAS